MSTQEQQPSDGKGESGRSAMTPSTTHTAEPTRRHDPQRRSMRPFEAMLANMDRFFLDPSGWFPFARVPREFGSVRLPRMDVVDKDRTLIVTAELPGVKKEDVHVEMADGALVIYGESRSEHEEKEHGYVRMERTYGSFHRRLPLGFDVEPTQITATLKNGVLEVRIPEPAEAKDNKGAEIPIS